MGIIGRQEGSMSPRAIGRRRDRNYRTRTDERTNENVARYIHACAYYGASRDKEEKRRARIGENFLRGIRRTRPNALYTRIYAR